MTEIKDDVFSTLDSLLSNINLDKVTADGAGFQELPDGYYLSEVESAEIKMTKTGKPMVSMKFKVVEDGHKQVIDDEGNVQLTIANKSANRKIFMNWVLSDENSVVRYVSDMLKFEETAGVPMLDKELFLCTSTMTEALDVLIGNRIYIMIQTVERDGQQNKKQNLVKWSTAAIVGLPL